MKKATLKDIAQAANVSIATVSNVLNDRHHKVSQETVAQIQALAQELQYTPNLNAKALVTKASRLVSVLFYSSGRDFNYSDPFVASLLEGIERIARQENYYILLHNIESLEAVHQVRRQWAFAGHIVVGCDAHMAAAMIESVSEPLVFIDTYLTASGQALVEAADHVQLLNSKDYDLAYAGVELLARSQGLDLAFLSYQFDPDQVGVIQARYAGANAAYQAAGGQGDLPIYLNTKLDDLIKDLSNYRGLMVTADVLAMELVKVSQSQLGQWDPERRLMSFDNIPYLQYLATEVNTIDLNQVHKGEEAMASLSRVLQSGQTAYDQRQQYIPANLINKNLSLEGSTSHD